MWARVPVRWARPAQVSSRAVPRSRVLRGVLAVAVALRVRRGVSVVALVLRVRRGVLVVALVVWVRSGVSVAALVVWVPSGVSVAALVVRGVLAVARVQRRARAALPRAQPGKVPLHALELLARVPGGEAPPPERMVRRVVRS